MIGASSVPEVVDPAVAEKEVELAVLSALAHGNGPNGEAVLEATQTGLERLAEVDREHAAAYFQMIYNMLRGPMRRALEALVMQQQAENESKWIPLLQSVSEEGQLKGKRDALLRLIARAAVPLGGGDRARILACTDGATLDRWLDNVLGAKSGADILS